MPVVQQGTLTSISDKESLFDFLEKTLGWQVTADDPFTYEVTEIEGADGTAVKVTQVVKFHAHDPFVILLAEFEGGFRRTQLREILKDLKQKMRRDGQYPGVGTEDIILICPSGNYRQISFAHFEERDGRQPSLSVFGWDTDEAANTRTIRELNLSKLGYSSGLQPDEWRRQWLAAWDVSAVTNDFFTTYSRVFELVESKVDGIDDKRALRLFTQRLFNRLLFIKFLEKKNWMSFGGRRDYLNAMFEAAEAAGENFYSDRLYWAFFHGLGVLPDSREAHSLTELVAIRGSVPYLSGGLFEMEDASDARGAVEIPNDAFKPILEELFARYNFTITESAPDDVEVAVDPEMLGKVFEELVVDRHGSGSYYTPRPIVSFMCREALKGYLGGHENLIDHHDNSGITVPVAAELLARLEDFKAVDPACGSGAYLLGMLYELFTLTKLLDTRAGKSTARTDYQRKLQLIQNNLYGVDIDPFAINIARLRLWLSLVVEFSGESPEPLPNLDFKLEIGDSLIGPNPETVAAGDLFRHEKAQRFAQLKEQYSDPYYAGDKQKLRSQINAVRAELAAGTHLGQKTVGFDWRVEFAEVFERDRPGFDAVVANPPYIRQEEILQMFGRDYKDNLLRNAFPTVWTGTADLYVFFYARAISLLCEGGTLAFISSNKWFKADYGAKLRSLVVQTCCVSSITDFGELPVFQSAATFPMVFVARKKATSHQTPVFTQVKSLDPPYPDVLAIQCQKGFTLPSDAISDSDWLLTDCHTIERIIHMRKLGTPLWEYVHGRIYYGIKTGFNEAFYIDSAKRDELIREDPKSDEIIKPLAIGDDIRKWRIRERNRWMIVTKIGTDIERYPAVFTHLKRYREELMKRQDQGEHWWELRACAYYDIFDRPKIVYPQMMLEPRFTLDGGYYYTNQKCFVIAVDDLFLLGLLNSKAVWAYLSIVSLALGDASARGRLEPRKEDIASIRVPSAAADRTAIEELVQKCLDAKGVDCEEWEREIDERVEFLYFGQTPGSATQTYEQHQQKLRHDVELVILQGEGQTIEFKESLEWDVKLNKPNKALVEEVITTICGFLNAEGGTLLIGVSNDGDVKGLEHDYKLCGKNQNKDGLELRLRDLIKSRLNPAPIGSCDITFISHPAGDICRIDVKPSTSNICVGIDFHLREGNRTIKLQGQDLERWLASRHPR